MQYDFIKQELTGTCIICGSPSLPDRVCEECDSTKCSGRKIEIHNDFIKNACDIAGEIIRLCLAEYKSAYRKTIENPYREAYRKEFEVLDKEFRTGYYQALSLGYIDAFLDGSKKQVENDMEKAKKVT